MTLRSEAIRAIRERHVVELRYDRDAGSRIVCPHVLYEAGDGKEYVDAYQVEGQTRSGALPDWREFDLSKIRRLDVLATEFAPAPGYNPSGEKYRRRVIARA
jgi:predicted DNA-binding transcriptional regulator YafY